MSNTTKTISLSWRELNVAYNVDYKSVAEMAASYGITWTEMKAALHECGFTVRKGEVRPDVPVSDYTIQVIDDRPEGAKKKSKPAAVTTATADTTAAND